jgi:hypothetical protein
MNVELINPSPWHPLRVASQTRARNVVDAAHAAPAPAPHETREELLTRGAAITMKKTRISTKFGSELRDVPTPLWQAEGADSLAHWVTEAGEHYQRTAQAPAPAVPRGERVVDAWGALQPRLSVPPGGKAVIQLEEHTRLAITCEEPVTLQLSNTSTSRTLRLRTLDTASGATAHVSFIPPARDYPAASIVSANGAQAAVVEMMAT